MCKVASIYGYVGESREAKESNNELHRELFDELVEQGKTDWIIGGDWNMELQDIDERARGGNEVAHTQGPETFWQLRAQGEENRLFHLQPEHQGEN